MVDALIIIAAPLAAAFFIGLLRDEWRLTAYTVSLLALTFTSWIAANWLWYFSLDPKAVVDISTAGVHPPFAINLRIGLAESAALLLVSLTGLLSTLYLRDTLLRLGRRAMAVLLVFVMAICGVILTRDVFNLFVFFELIVIATSGLVLLSSTELSLGSGFKYLMASQVISILLLVGIIFSYHVVGSLNIDDLSAQSETLLSTAPLAFFLLFIAVIIELKPFPANGWALDIYESAHPAFSAILSAATATASLFAVDKILSIGGEQWLPVATIIGVLSFIGANLFALAQSNDRRLLGYSSVAQIGLILAIIGQQDILGDSYFLIAGGVLLGHAVAKAGLFWLSGLIEKRELTAWTALRQRPLLVFAFITFIALLIGLPPFPGFYAKWELIHILAGADRIALIVLILFGALLETTFLFRWFGQIMKHEASADTAACPPQKISVIYTAVASGWGLGFLWGELSALGNLLHAVPLLIALLFAPLEWLPARIKNVLAIAALISWFIIQYPLYDPLQLIFAAIIMPGGALILLASFYNKGRRIGFYPSALWMFAGLSMLIVAEDSFTFFAAWESLTIGSYFLILRGRLEDNVMMRVRGR